MHLGIRHLHDAVMPRWLSPLLGPQFNDDHHIGIGTVGCQRKNYAVPKARLFIGVAVHGAGEQAHFLLPIQVRYGDRVRVESFTEEHIFTIESLSPDLEVDEVIREFGLVEFNAYLQRCERRQDKARGKTSDTPSSELAEV